MYTLFLDRRKLGPVVSIEMNREKIDISAGDFWKRYRFGDRYVTIYTQFSLSRYKQQNLSDWIFRKLGAFVSVTLYRPKQEKMICGKMQLWSVTLGTDGEVTVELKGGPMDLSKCPECGGTADNGFSRDIPPVPYVCTKCEGKCKVM